MLFINKPGAPWRSPVPMSPVGCSKKGRCGCGGGDPYDTDSVWASINCLIGQERQRQRPPLQHQWGGSGRYAGRDTEATGAGRNVRRGKRFCSALALGKIFEDSVDRKENPGRLQLFSFLSGKRKEEVNNINIKNEDVRINQQMRHCIGRNCR